MGTRMEAPVKLNQNIGACAAVRCKKRNWPKGRPQGKPQGLLVYEIACTTFPLKQSWRQASMQVLNSSVARPWKLEQKVRAGRGRP